MAGHGPMIIPDTFSTPVVDDVMRVKRQVHYSRSERKARMKHSRLQDFQRWVPGNESDKSAFCPRWDTMSQHQLDSWRDYFLARHPLTDEEKSRLVLTDRDPNVEPVSHDPASKIIRPESV